MPVAKVEGHQVEEYRGWLRCLRRSAVHGADDEPECPSRFAPSATTYAAILKTPATLFRPLMPSLSLSEVSVYMVSVLVSENFDSAVLNVLR